MGTEKAVQTVVSQGIVEYLKQDANKIKNAIQDLHTRLHMDLFFTETYLKIENFVTSFMIFFYDFVQLLVKQKLRFLIFCLIFS